MILDEISKMLKVHRTDKKTERGQTNNQKSLLELTAQVELKIKLEKNKIQMVTDNVRYDHKYFAEKVNSRSPVNNLTKQKRMHMK